MSTLNQEWTAPDGTIIQITRGERGWQLAQKLTHRDSFEVVTVPDEYALDVCDKLGKLLLRGRHRDDRFAHGKARLAMPHWGTSPFGYVAIYMDEACRAGSKMGTRWVCPESIAKPLLSVWRTAMARERQPAPRTLAESMLAPRQLVAA